MVSRRIRLRTRKQLFVFCVAIAVVLLPWWRAELTRGDERNIAYATSGAPRATSGLNPLPGLDMEDYDRLLHTYVTDDGWVDYGGLARERDALKKFLDSLGSTPPNSVFRENRDVIEQGVRHKYAAGDTEPDGSVLIHSGELARPKGPSKR